MGKGRYVEGSESAVRLSQCMIVKNEERNIEQALGWAKDVAYEQIVVDTGSSDRTVELAKNSGARVYHFKWIDDFAAAKNFAMDKASGNWIAILDADEYVPPEDTKVLMNLLEDILNTPELNEKYDAISCPRWNLDDKGNAASVIRTSRFFKNRPDLRYKGRIHEQVTMKSDKRLDVDNVRIMHTGYLGSEVEATGKAGRNIGILRAELANDPNNLNLKAYLADSLWMASDKDSHREALMLFTEVINGTNVAPGMKKTAYSFIINKYVNDPEKRPEGEMLCIRARREFPEDIDFKFFHAAAMNGKGEFQAAFDLLVECLDKVETVAEYGGLSYVSANPLMLYKQIFFSTQGLEDIDGLIKYVTIVLTSDKTLYDVLCPYIAALLKAGKAEDEILDLLSGVYEIINPGDLMLIADAAKGCGAPDFAQSVLSIVQSELSKTPLLTGVTASSAVYLRDVITPVLKDDLQMALDEIIRLSESEVPDEYSESYLLLAQNICAACEYADGWVMFNTELARFLLNTGRELEASARLKELHELFPEDETVLAMLKIARKAMSKKKELTVEAGSMEEAEPGFDRLMQTLGLMSEDEIYELILNGFTALSAVNKSGIENYLTSYPFWGAINEKSKVYDALRGRARLLHRHHEDLKWLYERLSDARSKNVLLAIISGWVYFDSKKLHKYAERELPEYYHPDIFPPREDEVFIDLGAYNGDSTAQFIESYGMTYKHIYCYEIAQDNFQALEKNLKNVPNIELRKKAAGAAPGKMYVSRHKDLSASHVSDSGETAIEVVSIDDDIKEPVTFIKMDIEGAEKDAIHGCKSQIQKNHPRLAICTYHGYDDIYQIPRMIDEIEPGYNFYMRYHGGDRTPTEYSLLAVWDSENSDQY